MDLTTCLMWLKTTGKGGVEKMNEKIRKILRWLQAVLDLLLGGRKRNKNNA